jgi:hypothetical protein
MISPVKKVKVKACWVNTSSLSNKRQISNWWLWITSCLSLVSSINSQPNWAIVDMLLLVESVYAFPTFQSSMSISIQPGLFKHYFNHIPINIFNHIQRYSSFNPISWFTHTWQYRLYKTYGSLMDQLNMYQLNIIYTFQRSFSNQIIIHLCWVTDCILGCFNQNIQRNHDCKSWLYQIINTSYTSSSVMKGPRLTLDTSCILIWSHENIQRDHYCESLWYLIIYEWYTGNLEMKWPFLTSRFGILTELWNFFTICFKSATVDWCREFRELLRLWRIDWFLKYRWKHRCRETKRENKTVQQCAGLNLIFVCLRLLRLYLCWR